MEISEIIELARRANSIAISMFEKGNDPNDAIEKEKMKDIEKKSDEIAFQVSMSITNGAISSNILDNLLQCVGIADDIVDSYYFLSREIARMDTVELSSPEGVTSDFNPSLVQLLKLADGAMEILQKLLASSNLQSILELRKAIQALEEEGDNLKDSGFDRLYAVASKMHYLGFNHLSELLHKLDDILDDCEDLSDLVVSIITSISK
ncbi:MAG TPA: DUF47 family protein [Nitrososphaerales archaeon]|nr:DUF47 family protein [Nitrososphaerales archaeon]